MSFDKELMFRDIPDKRQYKETTSLKFKEDLIELFGDIGQDYTVLEVGTNHGHTTRILSFLFKNVITLDWREEPNLRMAKELNFDRDNITYIEKDVYKSSWDDLKLPKFQVSFIDCDHEYTGISADIQNCIKYGDVEQYMIFDDYGHPEHAVKRTIQDVVTHNSNFRIVEYIGEPEGGYCPTNASGTVLILNDYEGVICKYENK